MSLLEIFQEVVLGIVTSDGFVYPPSRREAAMCRAIERRLAPLEKRIAELEEKIAKTERVVMG